MDDLWRLRLRRDAFLAPDPGPVGGGCPTFVGKVVTASPAVGKFMKVNPVDLTGAEAERGAGTLTANTGVTVLVYALGPTAPAAGDYVVCRHVNHRWVADKQAGAGGGGGTTGFTTCCPSDPVPSSATLSFTFGSGTSAANYCGRARSQTLTFYATKPAWYEKPFGTFTPQYVSPTFVDDLGNTIYYAVFCNSGDGSIQLAIGTVGAGSPSFCCNLNRVSCSPFLINGIVGTTCFTSAGCPTAPPGAAAFGANPGDNITMS